MKRAIQKPVRVRFAPSPTGYLHIGSLRTALFNWLFARHHNGQFLIRIEDTDIERSKPEFVAAIKDALRWTNIQPDEPIIVQSERLDEHKTVIEKLLREGKAYKCYCSQEDIAVRAGDNAFIKYDEKCRSASDTDGPYVIRFKLPDFKEITFDDLIRGPISVARDQLDDFIIARSDGRPMYNFVVVVDDAAMKITQVIRGEDHISNTPKQMLLYQACGYQMPQFAHIPLILGPSGDRLSKRDGATSVFEYKNEGYLPDALINYLVRLGWAHGDQEVFTRKELIEYFTLEAVGKKGAIFDRQKLDWVNSVYIKNMSNEALLAYIQDELDQKIPATLAPWSIAHITNAIALYKERVHTIQEHIKELSLLHKGPDAYTEADLEKWTTDQTATYLTQAVAALDSIENFTSGNCSIAIKKIANELGIKFVALAQPIRIALIGKSTGPGIFDLLSILGKKTSRERIERLIDQL